MPSVTHPSLVLMVPTPYVARQFGEVAEQLRRAGVNVELYRSADACLADATRRPEASAILSMHDFPMSREFLVSMPNLRAALSFITGTEGFDEAAATDLGIVVANGQIAENFHSMAEATVMLVLAAFYDLRGAEHDLRHHSKLPGQFRASMLMGKTVGILGFGKIAQAVAERLAGWGVRLQVSTRHEDVVLPSGIERVPLDDLCRTSDCLILLANLNAESRHVIDARRLALMKRGSILVNTARGGLIDEQALITVAKTGRFRVLALDTFEEEPLPEKSPLRELPNAILTGHDVGHTIETHQALVHCAVSNIQKVLRGEPPTNIRNPAVVEHWRRRWRQRSMD